MQTIAFFFFFFRAHANRSVRAMHGLILAGSLKYCNHAALPMQARTIPDVSKQRVKERTCFIVLCIDRLFSFARMSKDYEYTLNARIYIPCRWNPYARWQCCGFKMFNRIGCSKYQIIRILALRKHNKRTRHSMDYVLITDYKYTGTENKHIISSI